MTTTALTQSRARRISRPLLITFFAAIAVQVAMAAVIVTLYLVPNQPPAPVSLALLFAASMFTVVMSSVCGAQQNRSAKTKASATCSAWDPAQPRSSPPIRPAAL